MIYDAGLKVGFAYAERLAGEAVEMVPDSPHYQHTYATIIAAQGRYKEALTIAPNFLKSAELGEQYPNDLISFFSSVAVAGFAKEGLDILKQSLCAPFVEPLIVALQMVVGEEYNAPQEVVEVAKDVVKEIESQDKKNENTMGKSLSGTNPYVER